MSAEQPVIANLKPSQNEFGAGPGRLLRQARVERQISVEQVANQLKLSTQMVHALETDNYSHINSLVFLKGYLRNYARLLGIEPEQLILQINTNTFESQRERPPAIEYKIKLFTRDQLIRWMTLAFGVVMVALVLMWWHSHTQTGKPLTLLPETNTPAMLPAQPLNRPFENTTPVYDESDSPDNSLDNEVTIPKSPASLSDPDASESFAEDAQSSSETTHQ